jgi:GNAT superfamily N-acetyltransferase
VADDLARIDELLATARHGLGGQRGGSQLLAMSGDGSAAAGALGARALAGDPDAALFVGLFEGEIVGAASGSVAQGTGQLAYCYVEPEARGVGVGGALLSAMVGWFVERGCRDIDAVALPGDRSMKQLLEAAGFKARLLILHRSTE